MAFLRYRREVVEAWPESSRKAVVLMAIERQVAGVQQVFRMMASLTPHPLTY